MKKGLMVIMPILLMLFMLLIPFYFAKKDISFDKIEEVSTFFSWENVKKKDAYDFQKRYGVSLEMIENIIYYASDSPMNVDEYVIIYQSDATMRDTLYSTCLSHIEKQKAAFDGYGVEQMKRLENAIVEKHGNYVYCFVGAQSDAFMSALEGVE